MTMIDTLKKYGRCVGCAREFTNETDAKNELCTNCVEIEMVKESELVTLRYLKECGISDSVLDEFKEGLAIPPFELTTEQGITCDIPIELLKDAEYICSHLRGVEPSPTEGQIRFLQNLTKKDVEKLSKRRAMMDTDTIKGKYKKRILDGILTNDQSILAEIRERKERTKRWVERYRRSGKV